MYSILEHLVLPSSTDKLNNQETGSKLAYNLGPRELKMCTPSTSEGCYELCGWSLRCTLGCVVHLESGAVGRLAVRVRFCLWVWGDLISCRADGELGEAFLRLQNVGGPLLTHLLHGGAAAPVLLGEDVFGEEATQRLFEITAVHVDLGVRQKGIDMN